MKIPVFYREFYGGPVHEGLYDDIFGTIDNIPKSKFYFRLNSRYSEYLGKTLVPLSHTHAEAAMSDPSCCFAAEFMDNSILVVTKIGKVYYINRDNYAVEDLYYTNNTNTLFNGYKLRCIGIHNRPSRQIEYRIGYRCLCIDENDNAIIDGKLVKFSDYTVVDIDKFINVPGVIKLIREGKEIIYMDSNGLVSIKR